MIHIAEESKPFSLDIPPDGVIEMDVLWLNKAITIDLKTCISTLNKPNTITPTGVYYGYPRANVVKLGGMFLYFIVPVENLSVQKSVQCLTFNV